MTLDEKLDRILALLEQRLPASPVHGGPFQGQTPGGFGAPVDPALVASVLAAINLPQFGPGSGLVETWLREGHTPAEIVAAVNKLIQKTGIADRTEAAYQISTGHASGAWRQVTNLLAGKDEPNPVSHDPAGNLLDGLANVNGPADLAPVVDEVIARAEQGITWRGTRGREADSLEDAKVKLAADPLTPYWRGWIDERLLRILVLTNVLPLVQHPLMAYPDVATYAVQTVPEWLYSEWIGSR